MAVSQPIIIDTREDFEFASGHVDGAINIPPTQFLDGTLPSALERVEKDQEIIVYCRTGSRSNVVAHILRQHGFTNIVNGVNKQQVEKFLR